MDFLFAVKFFGIDPLLSLYAIVAFVVIGLSLAGMILFTRAKLVQSDECVIGINDDPDLTKYVRGGGTLLSSLTSEGVAVPSPCGGKATCLQCRVQIVEGADPPLETDKATFTKKELLSGWRLSCQSKVKHDLKLHIEESSLDVKEIEAKVVSNENVATFIKELVVELPEEIPYRSGEYFQFHVPPFKADTEEWKTTMEEKYYEDWETFKLFGIDVDFNHLTKEEIIRAYSMASYPAEKKKVIFNIRIATPPLRQR